MFRKVDVPVLGIVENMSYFIAPDTGNRYDIFGHGGARREAERLGVPFLGEVPLELQIRLDSDAGTPIVATPAEDSKRRGLPPDRARGEGAARRRDARRAEDRHRLSAHRR